MNKELYTGDSQEFEELVNGYLDYSSHVLLKRNFPNLEDGLKLVQRRIVYSLDSAKKFREFAKSIRAVGEAITIHPHGDGSIYEAMVGITDSREDTLVPLLNGQGAYGHVSIGKPPAEARYTQTKLAPIVDEFKESELAIEYIEDETGDGVEPRVFPVSFPYVLVSGASGVGVGFSTDIPPFNFHEVLGLVKNYIKNGDFTENDILAPDFPTGGEIVYDKEELLKIMGTGNGKVTVRASYEIQDKKIVVHEIPYGHTTSSLVPRLQKMEIKGIKSVYDSSGYHGTGLTIECTTKKGAEDVAKLLLKRNILQKPYTSRIITVYEDKPFFAGVFPVVEKWVEWRKGIIQMHYSKLLEKNARRVSVLSYFMELINDKPSKEKFIETITKQSRQKAKEFLEEFYVGIADTDLRDEVVEFVVSRQIRVFLDGSPYNNELDELNSMVAQFKQYVKAPETKILDDMKRLKEKYKHEFQRRTKISYQDFVVKEEAEQEEEVIPCWYVFNRDVIVKQKSEPSVLNEGFKAIQGYSNSVFVGFDSLGRGVRLFAKDLPYNKQTTFKNYFGSDLIKNYKVFDLYPADKIDEIGEVVIAYTDGYVSRLPLELMRPGKAKFKTIKDLVPSEIDVRFLGVFEDFKSGEYLVLETGKEAVIAKIEDMKFFKSSTARSKVVKSGKKFYLTNAKIVSKEEFKGYSNYKKDGIFFKKI